MSHILHGGNSAATYLYGLLSYLQFGFHRVSIITTPTVANLSFSKLQDGPFVSGDGGVMALAVRNDTLESKCNADGDYTPLQVNAVGSIYSTITYETTLNKAVVTASDASTNALVAAQGAGIKIAIVDIIISSSSAQNFIISDASTAILGPIYLSANSTTSINLNRPIVLTANQALNYTNSDANAHSVTVTYFTTT